MHSFGPDGHLLTTHSGSSPATGGSPASVRAWLDRATLDLLALPLADDPAARVAELAVPDLADLAVVYATEAGGRIRAQAMADARLPGPAGVPCLDLDPVDPAAPRGVAAVLRSRRPEVAAALDAPLDDGEALERLGPLPFAPSHLGIRASLIVPIAAETAAAPSGALALLSTRPGRYGAAETDAVQELGRRVAVALESADRVQRLAEEVAARDEFLAIAAHELNTPVTALELNVAVLAAAVEAAGQTLGSAVPDAAVAVGAIERQGRRVRDLLERLLDAAHLARGPFDLRTEPLELAGLAREAAQALSGEVARAGATLSVDAPEPVPGRWDRLRLEQVFVNLVGNALKYARGKPVVLGVRRDGAEAVLAVSDAGPGIARHERERIFRA
ncbi:MAG TPA: GAF domain-containing sensor histidine kinase, partial [Planctomycetota bacterium]|nr:GAF domain-containing sensor histidine kinase [Planctomycetota bacterium]